MIETVEEFGVRWRAGDFTAVQPHLSETNARVFAALVNPTGDARAEVVSRTVTEWQPVDQPTEVPA